jgi:hypothetical protein
VRKFWNGESFCTRYCITARKTDVELSFDRIFRNVRRLHVLKKDFVICVSAFGVVIGKDCDTAKIIVKELSNVIISVCCGLSSLENSKYQKILIVWRCRLARKLCVLRRLASIIVEVYYIAFCIPRAVAKLVVTWSILNRCSSILHGPHRRRWSTVNTPPAEIGAGGIKRSLF